MQARTIGFISACLALLIGLAVCPATAQVLPGVERSEVFPGHALPLPVRVISAPTAPTTVPVRIGAAETTGSLHVPAGINTSRPDPWLGEIRSANWRPWQPTDAGPQPTPAVLLIKIPPAFDATTLTLGGVPVRLSTFGVGERPTDAQPATALQDPYAPADRTRGRLAIAQAELIQRDALLRVRGRLLLDRLGVEITRANAAVTTDPVAAALAAHRERRLAAALARAWSRDPSSSVRVRRRIATTVRLDDREVVLFPATEAQLERLIDGLLQSRTFSIDRWLTEVPSSTIFDRGVSVASSGPVHRVGVLSWSEDAALALFSRNGSGTPIDLQPRTARELAVLGPTSTVGILAGGDAAQLDLPAWPIGIAPPGVTLAPLRAAFDAQSLVTGKTQPET
ncbi:MAG: hypothetical protein AAGI17_02235, partial [Planctomycetota bacterium]